MTYSLSVRAIREPSFNSVQISTQNGRDRTILVILAKLCTKLPWRWILCDPKHVGALWNIL